MPATCSRPPSNAELLQSDTNPDIELQVMLESAVCASILLHVVGPQKLMSASLCMSLSKISCSYQQA